jgi:glycerophosphoryl diester phosphodiesterase
LLYAHRGSSAELPENTLEAFQAALAHGANALELDVHPTRDSVLVVSHDPHGGRTAGVDAAIADMSVSELRRWRMRAPDGAASRSGVPTLAAVLETFPNVPMSIDLKVPDLRAADALVQLVLDHRAEPYVTLASFHELVMRHIRVHGYAGPTALTRREVAMLRLLPLPLAGRLVAGTAAQIPRRAGPISLDNRRFINRCRRLGLRVDFWVVNEPTTAIRLLQRGATGIMTDTPAQVAEPVWQWVRDPRRSTLR